MLEIRNVHTRRGVVDVLHNVTLEVYEQEVVCLVGRNGAGKTTVAETIMGHLSMRSGQIVFRGEDIGLLPPYQRVRRGIGYAPDYCGIFPSLTVAENMMISELVNKSSQQGKLDRKRQIVSIFPEIQEFLKRPGGNLSGGQKKMLAIARAMTLSPSLLVLDEALEGLAPVVVSRFIDAVFKIKEMGISLLLAESNLRVASRIADRMYAIDRGEIIFDGTPDHFLKNKELVKTIYG